MEDVEEVIQRETENCISELLDSKKYELKYKEDIYSLLPLSLLIFLFYNRKIFR